MIEYINTQLNLWVKWQQTGHTRLGYPRKVAFIQSGGGTPPVNDDYAMRIDRAVRSLPPEHRQLVRLYYIHMRDAPADAIARELHVSRDTVYHRLHRAHVRIMETLNDIEAARETPSWRAKISDDKWRA